MCVRDLVSSSLIDNIWSVTHIHTHMHIVQYGSEAKCPSTPTCHSFLSPFVWRVLGFTVLQVHTNTDTDTDMCILSLIWPQLPAVCPTEIRREEKRREIRTTSGSGISDRILPLPCTVEMQLSYRVSINLTKQIYSRLPRHIKKNSRLFYMVMGSHTCGCCFSDGLT